MKHINLAVLATLAIFVSCAPKTNIIWNEGAPDESGIAIHELLICNAPEGLEWDLWGHFYDGCKLPCREVEGSMAKMYMYSGSTWRVEPVQEGDTVVLRYMDRRHKHSWCPRGFYIKMRKGRKAFTVPVECNFQPFERTIYPEYPLAELKPYDIVPALKSVCAGEGSSKIHSVIEKIVEGVRPEGYRLIIGEGRAVIEASDARGLRYGHVTLEKLMENVGSDTLQNMVIEDWPDLPFRSQMLDLSRLYYPLEDLKRLVNLLERCKMNALTLHVHDDENWRLEIDGLPELTRFGAFHEIPVRQEDGTYLCEKAVPPVKGSVLGKHYDGTSGYYSREEFVDLLKYAHSHGVDIILDVDMPGHCYAAVEAMKHRERTTGDTSFRLVDPADTSVYCSVQGYSGNVVDLALPSVFTFWGKVFDSIVSMYAEAGVPLYEICIGGDEVADGAWEGSPACQAAMNENGYTDINQLRCEFIRKINVMLRERGIRLSGYNEVIECLNDEVLAEVIDNCGRIWVWKLLDDVESASMYYKYANKGINVLIELPSHMNFDNARTMNWDDRGLDWAGTLDEIKAFTLLPFNIGASRRFDNDGNPCDISSLAQTLPELKHPENICGALGMLWGDNLWTSEDAFSMLLPKAYGAWERNWNARPVWESTNDPLDPVFMDDFIHFFTVVRQREIPYLERVGMNYWR